MAPRTRPIVSRRERPAKPALPGAVIVSERTRRVPQRQPRASAVGAGARSMLTSNMVLVIVVPCSMDGTVRRVR